MPVFDDLKIALAQRRDARFPPASISSDGGVDRLPLRHKISGLDLIDYIAGFLAFAHGYIEKEKLSGKMKNNVAPGEVRIDCSKFSVAEAFTINSSLLQEAPDYLITMDFSDAQLHGVVINLEYSLDPGNKLKAFHFVFDRATFSDRLFFKAVALNLQDGQPAHFFSNRVTIDAREIDARKELCITGKIGEIAIEKSKIGNLFIHDADFVNINFAATTFDGGVVLQTVRVQGDVSFAGAVVKSDATLSNCTFTLPPDLHDASFPSETLFLHTHYGLPKKKNSARFEFSDADINKAPGRFRALRVAMKKAGAQHEEADFFAHELRARRRAAMSRDSAFHMSAAEICISKLYDVASVFGTSISRALSFFVIWNVFFGVMFCMIDRLCIIENCQVHINDGPGQPFGGQPIVLLVLQNAFNPLALFSSNSTAKVLSSTFFVLSMLQSIGSVGIGALVLLAIKVRFQRGSGGGS